MLDIIYCKFPLFATQMYVHVNTCKYQLQCTSFFFQDLQPVFHTPRNTQAVELYFRGEKMAKVSLVVCFFFHKAMSFIACFIICIIILIWHSCDFLLKCACAKIALRFQSFLKTIIIIKMILNRKNRTDQRTIVEQLRNVNFFMSSTVYECLCHVCCISAKCFSSSGLCQ